MRVSRTVSFVLTGRTAAGITVTELRDHGPFGTPMQEKAPARDPRTGAVLAGITYR
jgi:hypothetical protein